MPSHQQLSHVRDHAHLGQEECLARYRRRWPDGDGFERCWLEAQKDAQRYRDYVLPPARQRWYITAGCALTFLVITAGYLVSGQPLPRGLGALLTLSCAVAMWAAWRYRKVRRGVNPEHAE